jgi:Fe-S-cluster-containing dehydrogenase component
MSSLSWNVFSGGSVTIDLEQCVACPTKACISACNVPNLGSALAAGPDGLPSLGITPERAAQGGCIECLACDLACQSDGLGALTFALPTPEIDAYLDELRAAGSAPGRGW